MRSEGTTDSLNVIAYRKLREQIVTLELAPGETLSEATLAHRLECGRAAIRYAIQHLQAERLVRVAARSGTSVAEFDLSELTQAYQVRTSLEILAARLCAQRLTHQDLQDMKARLQLARKMQQRGDARKTVGHVHAFYRGLRAASHNALLDSLSRIAAALTERFEYFCVQELARPLADLEQPEALLAAIATRDPDAAEAAMEPVGAWRASIMLSLIGISLQVRPSSKS